MKEFRNSFNHFDKVGGMAISIVPFRAFPYVEECNYVANGHNFNPLRPSIKLQILLLCFHTFITDVKGRSC